MHYVSTRGEAKKPGFLDTVLTGLAPDGGLYMPSHWPQLDRQTILSLRGKPYQEAAFTLMQPYIGGEISTPRLKQICHDAYRAFHHRAVAPLVQIAPNHFILELFHGPTLAFKDIAMQWLAPVMDIALERRAKHAAIIGATSGDTGGAAIEAFRGRENTDVFILYPHGRVSDVQRRQMTTVEDKNVHALAIEGTFDDCQSLVKSMFNHQAFRDRVGLSAVNSINWGRILAQIVYYFTAAISLGAPERPVSFCVPTGNFGDIFAGFAARQMGLPIERLIIATNINDILVRALKTGRYEARTVAPTAAPSMDIQISSNFERLLFEAYGRDAAALYRLMAHLGQSGSFTIDEGPLGYIKNCFAAESVQEAKREDTMASCLKEAAYLLDPHTAIGVAAAEKQGRGVAPFITLATAHPAKFPQAVKKATGAHPSMPAWLGDFMSKPERIYRLANNQKVVEDFILARSRSAH